MTKTNVPRLRFNEFHSEWSEKKLNEVSDRVTRKNKNLDSDLPLTISAQYGLVDQETFFNKKVASKDLSNYILVKRGEFAYNKSYSNGYPFGTIKSLKRYDMGVLSSLYIVFAIKENISHLFMDSFFDSNHWHKEVSTKTTEGARNHGLLNISPQDFMKSKIFVPNNIEEQNRIGLFISNLDNLIELQTKKLEQLKKLKKGYLQKMFPQDGELVPRLRFSGFSGEWKESKLGDYLALPKLETVEVKNSSEILSVKLNLKGIVRLGQDSTLKLGSTKYYKRRKNQFIYGKQNFFNGSMAIVPDEYDGLVSSGDVPSFDINDISPEFLLLFVSRKDYYKHSEKFANGTGSKRIHEDVFLNFNINVPSQDEQYKISNFFKTLNNQINIESEKLNSLKQQKKAYLQKMFI